MEKQHCIFFARIAEQAPGAPVAGFEGDVGGLAPDRIQAEKPQRLGGLGVKLFRPDVRPGKDIILCHESGAQKRLVISLAAQVIVDPEKSLAVEGLVAGKASSPMLSLMSSIREYSEAVNDSFCSSNCESASTSSFRPTMRLSASSSSREGVLSTEYFLWNSDAP